MQPIDSYPTRRFELWEYHVSHGTALIRSPRTGDNAMNVDIMFFGVEYIAVPRFLDGVSVEAGTDEDVRRVEAALGGSRELDQVWVLISRGVRHPIAAAKLIIRETTMEIFESPFPPRALS